MFSFIDHTNRLFNKCMSMHLNANVLLDSNANANANAIFQECTQTQMQMFWDRTQMQRIYINEDFTARRTTLTRECCALKRTGKLNDCWTASGIVMVKDNQNKIRQIRSAMDIEEIK